MTTPAPIEYTGFFSKSQAAYATPAALANSDSVHLVKASITEEGSRGVPRTGVITGLDHTPIVCNITKKFTVAKHFTQVDYAQGLFVHLVNRRWFDKLPQELQQIFTEVIVEESAKARVATRLQQQEQIAAAKADGVSFYTLSSGEKQQLVALAEPVYKEWGKKIGSDYLQQVRKVLTQ